MKLRSMMDWVNRNKLVLNVSKANSMILGSNHNISRNPELNLRMNDVYQSSARDQAAGYSY